jgi:uncharacterized protein (TIGR01777 family)
VVRSSGVITTGAEVTIRLPVALGLSIPWHLTHTAYDPPAMFRDEQLSGPFRRWRHTHLFSRAGNDRTTLLDEIEYELPFGIGAADILLRRELRRLFTFRHSILSADLELHSRWQHQPRQTILIAGSSGFIGQALRAFLASAGHTVRTLVRRPPRNDGEHFWDPSAGTISSEAFDGIDAVINLCGENIAAKRWTNERKTALEESRVLTTRLLAQAIATRANPPHVFISASGAGYYGDTGTVCVDETVSAGSDFLAQLCTRWENEAAALSDSSCRSVQLRLGMVLNAGGGALSTMLLPFLCGFGGRLGQGAQYVSWIGLQDLLGIVEHALFTDTLHGPVNCCAPESCTNLELTKTLGRVLKRPTIVPAPSFALRAVFGELSTILLSSSRLVPKKLLESNYTFIHSDLEHCLRFECGYRSE